MLSINVHSMFCLGFQQSSLQFCVRLQRKGRGEDTLSPTDSQKDKINNSIGINMVKLGEISTPCLTNCSMTLLLCPKDIEHDQTSNPHITLGFPWVCSLTFPSILELWESSNKASDAVGARTYCRGHNVKKTLGTLEANIGTCTNI